MKTKSLLLFVVTFFCPLWSCPILVEVFPDPTDVKDQLGEFVEIKLDSGFVDTLYVQLDNKAPLIFDIKKGNRLLLSHELILCSEKKGLICGDLGTYTLPNSRETLWKIYTQTCMDSVVLDKPKGGKSFQRIGYTDDWVIDLPTAGYGNPQYEKDLADCGFAHLEYELRENFWWIFGQLENCKNANLTVQYQELKKNKEWILDSLQINEIFNFSIPTNNPVRLMLKIPEDEIPSNNTIDTLLFTLENSPLFLTEVHHCPEEPEPEWIEIYNASKVAFSLSQIKICNRGNFFGTSQDSILPSQSLLISRDTASLREVIPVKEISMVEASIGILNNTQGSLTLCFENMVLDSISWDKSTSKCPAGFNPRTSKAEYTPGFQGKKSEVYGNEPFTYKLSSRILRKKGEELRVKIEGESDVLLSILDSAGRQVWNKSIPSMSNAWWNVPVQKYTGIGAAFIKMKSGTFEKVVGIVVRP